MLSCFVCVPTLLNIITPPHEDHVYICALRLIYFFTFLKTMKLMLRFEKTVSFLYKLDIYIYTFLPPSTRIRGSSPCAFPLVFGKGRWRLSWRRNGLSLFDICLSVRVHVRVCARKVLCQKKKKAPALLMIETGTKMDKSDLSRQEVSFHDIRKREYTSVLYIWGKRELCCWKVDEVGSSGIFRKVLGF